jgi:hypothetical protein
VKFRFEDQPHQAAAIAKHAVDLLDGVVTTSEPGIVGQAPGSTGHGQFQLDDAGSREPTSRELVLTDFRAKAR